VLLKLGGGDSGRYGVLEDQMERTLPEDIYRARPVTDNFQCHSFHLSHLGEYCVRDNLQEGASALDVIICSCYSIPYSLDQMPLSISRCSQILAGANILVPCAHEQPSCSYSLRIVESMV